MSSIIPAITNNSDPGEYLEPGLRPLPKSDDELRKIMVEQAKTVRSLIFCDRCHQQVVEAECRDCMMANDYHRLREVIAAKDAEIKAAIRERDEFGVRADLVAAQVREIWNEAIEVAAIECTDFGDDWMASRVRSHMRK